MSFPGNFGAFVPSSNVWDTNELQTIDINSPQFRELLVRLYQNLNRLSIATNIKESGYYDNANEFVTGSLLFPNPAFSSATAVYPAYRQYFRKVVNFGALPNAGTKSVAHNINPNTAFSFTKIYGCATDQTGKNYIPLPYASPVLVNNIELNADATNVNITTGSNRTNFTITYVVLEYVKS